MDGHGGWFLNDRVLGLIAAIDSVGRIAFGVCAALSLSSDPY